MLQLVMRLQAQPVIRWMTKHHLWDWLILLPFVYWSLKVRLQLYFFLRSPGQHFPEAADSQWYLNYAHALLAGKPIGTSMDDLLYIGYNLLLAGLIGIFKSPSAVLFLQSAIAGLAVILVYRIAQLLFNRLTAIVAAYLYCFHTWPITLWSVYILSDSFFISLLLLCVYWLLKAMQTHSRIYRILFIVSAVFTFFFRPAGVLIIGAILLCLLLQVRASQWLPWLSRYKLAIACGVLAAGTAFGVAFALGKFDPLVHSLQTNAKMVLYNIYAKGWVYDRPSSADHPFKPDYEIDVMNSLVLSFLVNNWNEIGVLYIKRMAAFLGPWVWKTDLHTRAGWIRLAENMVPVAFFMAGIAASIRNGLFKRTSILLAVILSVFLFCILLFIDGMYRYKAPSTPFLLILTAYGIERVFRVCLQLAQTGVKALLAARKRSVSSPSS